MGTRHLSSCLVRELVLLLAAPTVAPVCVRAAEPLEVVRSAFRASSAGLTSGAGKGIYREYEAVAGEEWTLPVDAEILTQFDGNKYHIELRYQTEYRGLSCRRITYDGKQVKAAWFPPRWLTRGQTRVITIQDYGDGLSRPELADFRWDVARLSSNVWDVERMMKSVPAVNIEIRESPEGDLIGSFPVVNSDGVRVQFECPKKFGFNIARVQVSNRGTQRPAQESRIEWKLAPNELWYVRSLQDDFVHLPENKRSRRVLKYAEFEPNVKVDPKIFTYEWLRRPMESQIADSRPGAK
jgi:hypothetical protein